MIFTEQLTTNSENRQLSVICITKAKKSRLSQVQKIVYVFGALFSFFGASSRPLNLTLGIEREKMMDEKEKKNDKIRDKPTWISANRSNDRGHQRFQLFFEFFGQKRIYNQRSQWIFRDFYNAWRFRSRCYQVKKHALKPDFHKKKVEKNFQKIFFRGVKK